MWVPSGTFLDRDIEGGSDRQEIVNAARIRHRNSSKPGESRSITPGWKKIGQTRGGQSWVRHKVVQRLAHGPLGPLGARRWPARVPDAASVQQILEHL